MKEVEESAMRRRIFFEARGEFGAVREVRTVARNFWIGTGVEDILGFGREVVVVVSLGLDLQGSSGNNRRHTQEGV